MDSDQWSVAVDEKLHVIRTEGKNLHRRFPPSV